MKESNITKENSKSKKPKRNHRFYFRFMSRRRKRKFEQSYYQTECMQRDCQIQVLQFQLRKAEELIRNLIEYSQITEEDVKNIVEKNKHIEKNNGFIAKK